MQIGRLSPSERFSCLIEGLMQDVAGDAPTGWLPIPLIRILWRRLRQLNARFAAVLARFRAGTLPTAGTLPKEAPKVAPPPPDEAPSRPATADPDASPRPPDLRGPDGGPERMRPAQVADRIRPAVGYGFSRRN